MNEFSPKSHTTLVGSRHAPFSVRIGRLFVMVRNVVLIFAAAAVLAGQTADMGVLLQRAIRKENVEGDLNGAIDLYKQVVAGASNRAVVAKALLGLGECYEKQGNREAQRVYERLVKEFSDQAEAAHEAQARLAAMGQTRGGEAVV